MSCIRTQQLILKPESLAKTISVDLLKINEVPQPGRLDLTLGEMREDHPQVMAALHNLA